MNWYAVWANNHWKNKPAVGLVIRYIIWDEVFKNGPSEICGRQPSENMKGYGLPFKLFKGCLPQILLGLFLNTLPYFTIVNRNKMVTFNDNDLTITKSFFTMKI